MPSRVEEAVGVVQERGQGRGAGDLGEPLGDEAEGWELGCGGREGGGGEGGFGEGDGAGGGGV